MLLPDFQYPDLVERGGFAIGPDPTSVERIDLITNLSLLSSGVLAVQLQSRAIADVARNSTISYRTHLVIGHTGALIGKFGGSHRILGGGLDLAVTYEADPVPRFAILLLPDFGQ